MPSQRRAFVTLGQIIKEQTGCQVLDALTSAGVALKEQRMATYVELKKSLGEKGGVRWEGVDITYLDGKKRKTVTEFPPAAAA